ncbi:MAG: J domain-containing protein [archaeon]
MTIINVKGHEFSSFQQKGYSARKAIQFKNKIISNLKKLGVKEDDIEIPLETVVIKKVPASASWYQEDNYLYFSYKNSTFIENLHIVSKIIELETQALLNNKKTKEEFIREFTEDTDIEEKRKEARELLGIDENCTDLEEINKKYKELAKECHPDKGGNTEKFQILNRAHKMLKRELE